MPEAARSGSCADDAGFNPKMSTGNSHNADKPHLRENTRMTPDRFLERVHERLTALDMTATAACKLAGLNSGFLRDIRRRNHAPGIDKLQRLAAVLGCSPGYLMGEPTTGVADFSAHFEGAPLDRPRMVPEITASDPRDDIGYAELADAAEAMLAEEGEALSPRRFADLIHRLWQDFLDRGEAEPVPARVAAVIEQRRRMIRAARSLALGPGRRL